MYTRSCYLYNGFRYVVILVYGVNGHLPKPHTLSSSVTITKTVFGCWKCSKRIRSNSTLEFISSLPCKQRFLGRSISGRIRPSSDALPLMCRTKQYVVIWQWYGIQISFFDRIQLGKLKSQGKAKLAASYAFGAKMYLVRHMRGTASELGPSNLRTKPAASLICRRPEFWTISF